MYLVCAIIGCTLIVCQFLMTLFGMGHDGADLAGDGHFDASGHDMSGGHDVGHGHEPSIFFGMLSFRAISAALAFFGLIGLAAADYVQPAAAFGLAIAAGMLAMFIMAYLMRLLTRLNIDGTVRIQRSVGSRGTVYLSIPAQRGGVGKVHVSVLNRTIEYKAVTANDDLPTGAKVVVVGVISADTVEVAPAPHAMSFSGEPTASA